MQEVASVENSRKHASEGLDEEVCRVFASYHILSKKFFTDLDMDQAGTLLVTPKTATFMFFHDLPEAESQHWSSLLKPHGLRAMWSTQTYAAWQDIPSTYVICNLDRVMPIQKQEEMIKYTKQVQPKAFNVVERIESRHGPILSKLDDLVTIVERAANETGAW